MKILNCTLLGEMCSFLLDGEPVFVIRAQDALAVQVIEEYKKRAEFHQATNTVRVQACINNMKIWQKDHKVRMPD